MDNVRDELIELRGLRFHYRDWAGPGADAPVLVLLHGYTGHARSWDRFARGMCDKYRVLALDQRGHGETAWADPPRYGTLEMVADLKAFVAAMGLDRFSLLGLSMGGIVSFAYAGEGPAGLERLVIVDIAPEIVPAGLQRIYSGTSRADRFDSVEDAVQRARDDNAVAPDDVLRDRVVNSMMRTEDGTWTYRYDRALRNPDIPRERLEVDKGWARVAKIAVPTFLIRGALSDILDTTLAERFRDTAPDCQLIEVPGAGHSVPLDKPEGFLAAARNFL
ncbi:MAG: alpha/beta hydrolase [Rhodospirillaceae bacterium]|jgi:esterase|nr:alpha/beta hydrolase [Rhodospirillaceae bacterium]MBT5193209.1 alpha/beta hydrolase [Rhodospirillaceae bacterium]MBT5894648.1 alpha/beta hydrolase [Rhodospirillaceae bacterium]MBT6427685.1 alpha/beta hydrolase [Rhodospirillaceae bacterium]MBT7760808.1 alpha/beta hydrolase [Rhodospirillaceae bacterium]